MKVLMVSREYPPFIVGGVARHTFYLAKYLRKKGALVKVVSFGDPSLNSEDVVFIEPGSSIVSRDPKNVAEDAKVLFDIARFTSAVKSILKNEEFDVLHVQEPYVGGLISFEYKVTTIHDTSFGEIRSYLKYLDSGSFKRLVFYITTGYAMEFASIATSKVVINPSPDVAWEMIKIYRAPWEKLRVIPNGVEEPSASEPDRPSCRRLLGLPEDHFIVFSTAQHVGRKRLETMVKAAKILKDKGFRKFTVVIGGKGPLTKYLEELAVYLSVQDVLKFTGWIHDEELPLYYRAADAFVIPSEYEAGPITMLEAGIRGVPLIVSDAPSGFLMIARDGVHCLKFKLGDARDLAEKILTLSSDYGLWKKLAQGAKVFASAFRWDNVADKTMKVYKEVISG
jgi:glycosyltransferase involved in cell wall biosynthesis